MSSVAPCPARTSASHGIVSPENLSIENSTIRFERSDVDLHYFPARLVDDDDTPALASMQHRYSSDRFQPQQILQILHLLVTTQKSISLARTALRKRCDSHVAPLIHIPTELDGEVVDEDDFARSSSVFRSETHIRQLVLLREVDPSSLRTDYSERMFRLRIQL